MKKGLIFLLCLILFLENGMGTYAAAVDEKDVAAEEIMHVDNYKNVNLDEEIQESTKNNDEDSYESGNDEEIQEFIKNNDEDSYESVSDEEIQESIKNSSESTNESVDDEKVEESIKYYDENLDEAIYDAEIELEELLQNSCDEIVEMDKEDFEDLNEQVSSNEVEDDPQYGRENGYLDQSVYELQTFSINDANYVHNSKFDDYLIEDVIDVSHYQGDIDWPKVKAAGIDYAIIRLGYRGYGEAGLIKTDSKFVDNIEQAIAAGIYVGVYFFSQAISEAEAEIEAEYVLERINEYQIPLPVVIDFEYASSKDGHIGRLYNANLSREEATKICQKFCMTVENSGYTAMIYANKDMLQNNLDATKLAENYKIWLANYATSTSYEGEYEFWQYTQNGAVDGILGNVDKSFWYNELKKDTSILYSTHIQDIGWQEVKADGDMSGTSGQGKRLEGIRISTESSLEGSVEYRVHIQDIGWQEWKTAGELAGTTGQKKRLEAIRIRLTGEVAEKYDVWYRVHLQDYGWMNWTKNGKDAGSMGLKKRLEAIQIILTLKEETPKLNYKGVVSTNEQAYIADPFFISYRTHVQDIGWQEWKTAGELSGTTGKSKRIEAIEIKLNNSPMSGGIVYQAYIEGSGWQEWKENGKLSGTTGQKKRIEAIQVKLTGELADYYDICYRVHIKGNGWLSWAKNGEPAGSEGLEKHVEATQIVLVEKGKQIDRDYQGVISENDAAYICPNIRVAYQAYIQDIGWQETKHDGETVGTIGESKRIGGLKINLQYNPYEGGITYQAHVQNIGWQEWKSDGDLSGASNLSNRIEAVKIKLTGEVEKYYDVCYRVHVQDYGWLNWTMNGDIAGTTGQSKRVEAIEVILVEKGTGVPATLTSGTITEYSISGGSKDSMNVKVEAEVKTKVASDDNYYYVVALESYGNSYNKTQSIAKIQKTEHIFLNIEYDSNAKVEAALMNKIALAILKNGQYELISTSVNISNPEALATNTTAIFQGTSKKGLQGITYASYNGGSDIVDARNANTKHTLLNLNIASIVSTTQKSGYIAYSYKGKTYYFSNLSNLKANISSLNAGYKQYLNGNPGTTPVAVSLCLLLGYNAENSYLIDPAARASGHAYYLMNVREEKGRETLEALFLYLGETFGQENCYVSNWILGNEINSSKAWNYGGNLNFETYMDCYTTAFRLLYNGVKSTKTGNTVCISLDNGWTAAPDTYAGKTTLDTFAKKIHEQNPNIDWSIAYHAYSYPLTRADFWNDYSNTTDNLSTKYISMRNINVLTNYAGTLENTYGKTPGTIRVLLTEQGYSYGAGAEVQAQAIARGYYIAQFNDRIDAFIIRAVMDDKDETQGRLYFGLMNRLSEKRIAFYVYEYMDSDIDKFSKVSASGTVSSANYSKFNKAKEIVCNTNWSSIVPGFDKAKLANIK